MPIATIAAQSARSLIWHIATATYPDTADTLCGEVQMPANVFTAVYDGGWPGPLDTRPERCIQCKALMAGN